MSKGLNGSVQVPIHSGWRRDLPDPRDYTVENDQVFRLLANLPALNQLPSSVDLRGDADGPITERKAASSYADDLLGGVDPSAVLPSVEPTRG